VHLVGKLQNIVVLCHLINKSKTEGATSVVLSGCNGGMTIDEEECVCLMIAAIKVV